MPVLPCFDKFSEQAKSIGKLLAAYTDLELALLNCVQVARDDLDAVLKAMFRVRGETMRIDIADGLGRHCYFELGLDTQFVRAISAMRFCLKIRNQYSHCVWYDDNSGVLAFSNLEEVAKSEVLVGSLRDLTTFHITGIILSTQIDYYEYTNSMLVWLNYEGRRRAGKSSVAVRPEPSRLHQPQLRIE